MFTLNFLKELDKQVALSKIPVPQEDIDLIKVFVVHLPIDFGVPFVKVKKGIINLIWKKDKNNYVKMSLKGNRDFRYKINIIKKSGKVTKKRRMLIFKKGIYPKTFIKAISKLNNVRYDLSLWYEDIKTESHNNLDQTSSMGSTSGDY